MPKGKLGWMDIWTSAVACMADHQRWRCQNMMKRSALECSHQDQRVNTPGRWENWRTRARLVPAGCFDTMLDDRGNMMRRQHSNMKLPAVVGARHQRGWQVSKTNWLEEEMKPSHEANQSRIPTNNLCYCCCSIPASWLLALCTSWLHWWWQC